MADKISFSDLVDRNLDDDLPNSEHSAETFEDEPNKIKLEEKEERFIGPRLP